MPRSATVRALLKDAWYELQSDLQMVATHAGLGSVWERLRCEPMLTVTSPRLGAA